MKAAIALLLLTFSAFAQENPKYACGEKDRSLTKEFFENKREIETLADRFRQTRRGQLPFCWGGCVVKLPKPTFPSNVKNAGFSGTITIYAVADETGRVFYARPASGPKLLRDYARQAACVAQFTPIFNGDHPVKFPWAIRYNFIN